MQVVWRQHPGFFNPLQPLSMGYLPIKMQMDAMAGQLRYMMGVQADGSPRGYGMNITFAGGTQRRSGLIKPVTLGQVSIQQMGGFVQRQAGNDGIKPIPHFGAGEDLPVRIPVQVNQVRPGSLFKADERPLLE